MSASNLLALLNCARRNGKGWIARCTAHRDLHASVGAHNDDGVAPRPCYFVGCSPEAVTSAIGITVAELYPPKTPAHGHKPTARIAVLTMEAQAICP